MSKVSREDEIDDLLRSLTDALRAALSRAYEQGRIAGVSDAVRTIVDRNEAFLKESRKVLEQFATDLSATPHEEKQAKIVRESRAPPGSIRPAIIKVLKTQPNLRPSELTVLTGIKENTIRGTLRAMQQEGAAWKANGRWNLHASFEAEKVETQAPEPSKPSGLRTKLAKNTGALDWEGADVDIFDGTPTGDE